ncbi:MAG: hypothetical protein JXB23_13955 [Candidatus Aminicenantes bacterium]|nr:hypothetical protein [Candidatus Aminicenantes bacterium]
MDSADKPKVWFFSRFELTENGGGGIRRELQIAQALSPLNYRFISSLKGKYTPLNFWLKIRHRRRNHSFWREELRRYIDRIWFFSERWTKEISQDLDLVIMDNPLFFPPLVKKIKRMQIPLVVTCQNIESLSLAQINPEYQNRLFQQEINLLSMADLIITISREETFFLNNLNLRTYYYPYYPVESIKNRLLNIRASRSRTEKSGILLIGSVNNRVTFDGVLEVIEYWKRSSLSRMNERLIVAGFGTEELREICSHEAIDFLGPLSDSRLDAVLSNVKACLCFQRTGAGVLTKICEMLIAGIPVLANFQSARSYYHTDGLVEFAGLDELKGALSRIDRWEGNIPIAEGPAPDRLLAAIRGVMNREGVPDAE